MFKKGDKIIFTNKAQTDEWKGEKFKRGDRVIVFYSDDLIFNGRIHSIIHNVGLLYRIIDSSDNLWWFREDQLELDKGYYRNNKIAGII